MVELAEIGRAIELHTESWAWPMARRVFLAKTELQGIVGEVFR